jgi:hypothetical protein
MGETVGDFVLGRLRAWGVDKVITTGVKQKMQEFLPGRKDQ